MLGMRTGLWLGVLVLGFASVTHAAEIAAEGTPVRKLQRGFLNIALSPIELSNELKKEKKWDEGFIPSWVWRAGRGGIFAVGRALAGVYEMLSFPLPLPFGYRPLVRPEFAWQHFEN